MNLAKFLASKAINLCDIASGIQSSVGLGPRDILLAVGSLVEGLGNSKSDVDLLLITTGDASELPSREVALVVGNCVFDLQILPTTELELLIARFDAWAELPREVTHAPSFGFEQRLLLHRLLNSAVVAGEAAALACLVSDRDKLSRLKLQVARHLARSIQVDIAGIWQNGDYLSLVLSAQDLLGQAVDALAAGHFLTNPNPKWRSRLLEMLPHDWEDALNRRPSRLPASELFWSLLRTPDQLDRASALGYALRIATFARAVFVWAERSLVTEAACPAVRLTWPAVDRGIGGTCLPYLDFDVDFRELDGHTALGRLNESADPLELSRKEFEIALLFDGVTTTTEARDAVYGPHAAGAGEKTVENLVVRLARAGLLFPIAAGTWHHIENHTLASDDGRGDGQWRGTATQ
jgi:hypothetical protein